MSRESRASRGGAAMLLALELAVVAPATAASPFAAQVVDYSPKRPGQFLDDPQYNNPARALGRPYGKSATEADNTSVVTLGDGGSVTLAFDHDVIDDPANPGGYDFTVFSNALFIGGNPGSRWQEPAFVEVSQNGTEWYLLLPNKLPSELTGSDTGPSSTVLRNYAEYTPTLGLPATRTAEELYTVPDRQSFAGDTASLRIDPTSGGGDAFDIATAVRQLSPGVPLRDDPGRPVSAGITWFRYIRMTDAVIGDTWGIGEISAEIDAVADVCPALSLGAARRLSPDANYAVIWGAIVTAKFDGEFWMEQPDRSAGLRVVSPALVAEGNLVAVTGHVTDRDGDKAIEDAMVTVLDPGAARVRPLGISNRSAAMDLPLGLLVRAWGRRTAAGSGWFAIDDGWGAPVRVLCGPSAPVPGEGVLSVVTGVLTRDGTGPPVVRTRSPADITF